MSSFELSIAFLTVFEICMFFFQVPFWTETVWGRLDSMWRVRIFLLWLPKLASMMLTPTKLSTRCVILFKACFIWKPLAIAWFWMDETSLVIAQVLSLILETDYLLKSLPLDVEIKLNVDGHLQSRLKPGRMLLVDTKRKKIIEDVELKLKIAQSRPHSLWLVQQVLLFEIYLTDTFHAPLPSLFSESILVLNINQICSAVMAWLSNNHS